MQVSWDFQVLQERRSSPGHKHFNQMEIRMNWDKIKGNWKQVKGSVKSKWGELTDDELTQVNGERDKIIGKIQEKYGISRDEAEKQVDDWAKDF